MTTAELIEPSILLDQKHQTCSPRDGTGFDHNQFVRSGLRTEPGEVDDVVVRAANTREDQRHTIDLNHSLALTRIWRGQQKDALRADLDWLSAGRIQRFFRQVSD